MVKMEYKIFASHQGIVEKIDNCFDQAIAVKKVEEYKAFYGKNWLIWFE